MWRRKSVTFECQLVSLKLVECFMLRLQQFLPPDPHTCTAKRKVCIYKQGLRLRQRGTFLGCCASAQPHLGSMWLSCVWHSSILFSLYNNLLKTILLMKSFQNGNFLATAKNVHIRHDSSLSQFTPLSKYLY